MLRIGPYFYRRPFRPILGTSPGLQRFFYRVSDLSDLLPPTAQKFARVCKRLRVGFSHAAPPTGKHPPGFYRLRFRCGAMVEALFMGVHFV